MSGTTGNDELEQVLRTWLDLPSPRERRRFLEAHLELLDARSDTILHELLAQETESHAERQRWRGALALLQDARARGGTQATVREAYVNVYGGFALDLPAWLEVVEQQLGEVRPARWSDPKAALREGLLRQSLARAKGDGTIAPETLAALHHALSIALQQHPYINRVQAHKAAIKECEEALNVYALSRYPYQYAAIQHTLARSYSNPVVETGQMDDNRQAITCYYEALSVFTPDCFPYEYAQTQHGLGTVHVQRITGGKRQNREQAISYFRQALNVLTLADFSYEYAQTQKELGLVYFFRITGERRDNREQAIACYQEALHVFRLEEFPYEYAEIHYNLGAAYWGRVAGEQRDNFERAIACYREALRVFTLAIFPYEYAEVQNVLGLIYWNRIAGERRDNLERAIACYREALQVFTKETFPWYYGVIQNNLGLAYRDRLAGARRDHLEQAIACFREVLRVWNFDETPIEYARAQYNLGTAYQERIVGERRDNLEQAIVCYQEALRARTIDAFPYEYAQTQQSLGTVYKELFSTEGRDNLAQAIACYQEALRMYDLNALPLEHRRVQLAHAEAQAQQGNWLAAHDAYTAALEAENLLVALGTGAVGRDAILKEGGDAAVHDGFALMRLGRIEEAAVAIEQGRARDLAESIQFNVSDPTLISDEERRSRYMQARQAFVTAQAALHAALPSDLDEDTQRQHELDRIALYRNTKAFFDTVVAEIREAGDPADFLSASLTVETILGAAEYCGQGHTLVCLAATPWGGFAIAAMAANPTFQTTARFAAIDLPALTTELVSELLETHVDDDADAITGGFDSAQSMNGFNQLQRWPGTTFRERAEALHTACQAAGHVGTLDLSAQEMLSIPVLAPLVDASLDALRRTGSVLLRETLNHALLQRELQRCQKKLAEVALRPVLAWLREEGVSSVTFIPCGSLATFPLVATPLNDGSMVGETLPASVAPNARSLLREKRAAPQRAGIYALGNPYPAHQELRWSEAEAFTLAKLAGFLGLPNEARAQWSATRDWLIHALQTGLVVDASCHGKFNASDFLRSCLILANQKELTLADLLSYQVDLCGLRLLILSACQTALLDLKGARDEVRSLATGMLQAGVDAVMAALWPVDDKATYLLIVRFAQEWLHRMDDEAPAAALARAQRWLRSVTNRELQTWQATLPHLSAEDIGPRTTGEMVVSDTQINEQEAVLLATDHLVSVRGYGMRFDAVQAQERVRDTAEEAAPESCPYADPYYWAGFQVHGW